VQLDVSIYTILAIQAGQSSVFHKFRSKRAVWPSCPGVLFLKRDIGAVRPERGNAGYPCVSETNAWQACKIFSTTIL
jgi:hypothetical protein